MQHLNIVVIALRRRAAASKHHGEGNAEHYKGVINVGTGRFGCMYVGKRFDGVALLVHERIVSEQVDRREKSGIVMRG